MKITVLAEVHSIGTTATPTTSRMDQYSLTTTDTDYTTDVPAFSTELFNVIAKERSLGYACDLRLNVKADTDKMDTSIPQERLNRILSDSSITTAQDITDFINAAVSLAVSIDTIPDRSGY